MTAIDGRRFARELTALVTRDAEGRFVLGAPMPGLFRGAPAPGTTLGPGGVLGELEVLGERYRLRVPDGARGAVRVVATGRAQARRPVAYGGALVALDPSLGGAVEQAAVDDEARATRSGALQLRAPMSGRYYARPAPDAAPFVQVGDIVELGRSVAVLEVMKTFNRVQYGGAGLPERAKVVAIVPADGDDVNVGDPLLELERV